MTSASSLPAVADWAIINDRLNRDSLLYEGPEVALSFFAELRRRNVFRVAASYVIASWLIIQVVSAIAAPLNLPDWFETVVIVLLGIGFPIALLLAWAFELTPDGLRMTRSADGAAERSAGSRLDAVLIAALLIVAAATVWDRTDSSGKATITTQASVPGEKSIAVLPFADMSPGGNQEYFGDGVAEELLNELTRLEGLRVAGRTSSFSFKGSDADIRAIGEALNVNLVLEGSVRKDGDRIRITAQLINAADGYHFWSDTYDRELNDIFAIQDEIAAAVAGVLGVTLGVGDVNSFRGAGTASVEAYELYLQALQKSWQGGGEERTRLLEQALEIDPDYAAALAALGIGAASTMWLFPPEQAPEIVDRAISYLQRAVELRPDSAYAYSILATINYAYMDWNQSEDYYEKALAIVRDGETMANYANMLMRAGRSATAMRYYDSAGSATKYPSAKGTLAMNAYIALEDYSGAREIVAGLSPQAQIAPNAIIALNQGDPADVREAIAAIPPIGAVANELLLPLVDRFDSREDVRELLRAVYADSSVQWPAKYHDIALYAAYFGDPEFALEVFSVEARLTAIRFGVLWYPVMADVRRLPAFKELMRELNLETYWRTHGWSTHCQPVSQDDFECS